MIVEASQPQLPTSLSGAFLFRGLEDHLDHETSQIKGVQKSGPASQLSSPQSPPLRLILPLPDWSPPVYCWKQAAPKNFGVFFQISEFLWPTSLFLVSKRLPMTSLCPYLFKALRALSTRIFESVSSLKETRALSPFQSWASGTSILGTHCNWEEHASPCWNVSGMFYLDWRRPLTGLDLMDRQVPIGNVKVTHCGCQVEQVLYSLFICAAIFSPDCQGHGSSPKSGRRSRDNISTKSRNLKSQRYDDSEENSIWSSLPSASLAALTTGRSREHSCPGGRSREEEAASSRSAQRSEEGRRCRAKGWRLPVRNRNTTAHPCDIIAGIFYLHQPASENIQLMPTLLPPSWSCPQTSVFTFSSLAF